MNPPLQQLSYHKATTQDIPLVVSLVNAAYRGASSEMGWTTESGILGGQRTDTVQISRLMHETNSFILLCYQNSEAIGTAHLKQLGDAAYLGMFTVKPLFQNQGIGKQFLIACERLAGEEWNARKVSMAVITLRHELIAYYERRGYQRTGNFGEFPKDPSFGIPKVGELQFEYLEKML